jgi:acyl-CoA synthetase (AMP-forming)/AMP-acid ligase II
MRGLMQNWPLTVDRILTHAKTWHGHREVVTRSVEGPIVRATWAEVHDRAKQVSSALEEWGVGLGDRVATLAWNTQRHLECWYGIMGIGAVCHTLNPRLFADQLVWIINHAGDRIILADITFAELLQDILPLCPTVERVVFLTDETHMPDIRPANALAYEQVIRGRPTDCAWGEFDEETAAGLCYTSGTTGDPKGVLYSHRSNFLHCLLVLQAEVMGFTVKDVVLPAVPLYHANAWGVAFAAPAVGAKLVMPGRQLDAPSIFELLASEEVSFSAAVPTIWQALLQHLKTHDLAIPALKRVLIGGSACPESVIRAFHDDFGVEVAHIWGMTEMSPLGTICSLTPERAALPFDAQMPTRLKQGRSPIGVELKLADAAGGRVVHDGRSYGRLLVKGPAVAGAYFHGAGGAILDDEGFFDTGDIATIDAEGFMQITDRAKDVIKSGGEWISSIEIENVAVGHPKVELAAVIGLPHPKWDERPLLIVKLHAGEHAEAADLIAHLEGRIAKWWMPDAVLIADDIPLGATGKIDKKALRQRYATLSPTVVLVDRA